jgi:hypothetical protein
MKRQRLNAEQERYIIREMEKLEEYLYHAGYYGRMVTMATVYLAADLESLLLDLGIQVLTVDYESFREFIRDQEQRT